MSLPDLAYAALRDLPPVLTADEVASVLRIPKSSFTIWPPAASSRASS